MEIDDVPWHLCFPLMSSLLFPAGLILFKKAGQHGANSWTATFVANMCAASVFSILWMIDGGNANLPLIWQPGLVAILFISGQIFTFLALERGDVSVATPVLSVKVVLVAVMLTIILGEAPPVKVWLAACGATMGIVLIQRTAGSRDSTRYLFSVIFALLAATSFAIFDVAVQNWAPQWGPGSFLPIMFWMAAGLSFGFLPWVKYKKVLRRPTAVILVVSGGLLIALQAFLLVTTIAYFSDAARINIVYSMRGLWSVILAWAFAQWLAAGESNVSTKIMASRLVGALLLTVAVIVAIIA